MKRAGALLGKGGIHCDECIARLCDILSHSCEQTRKLSKAEPADPYLEIDLFEPRNGRLCREFFGFDFEPYGGHFSNSCPACGRGWEFTYHASHERTAQLRIDLASSDKTFVPPPPKASFTPDDLERELKRREGGNRSLHFGPKDGPTPFSSNASQRSRHHRSFQTVEEEVRQLFPSLVGKGWVSGPYDCDYHLSRTSPHPLRQALEKDDVADSDRVLVQISENLAYDRRMKHRARNRGETWVSPPLLERDIALRLLKNAKSVTPIDWEGGCFYILELSAGRIDWEACAGSELSVNLRFAVPGTRLIYSVSSSGGTIVEKQG